jgi:hypothetical protein
MGELAGLRQLWRMTPRVQRFRAPQLLTRQVSIVPEPPLLAMLR